MTDLKTFTTDQLLQRLYHLTRQSGAPQDKPESTSSLALEVFADDRPWAIMPRAIRALVATARNRSD